MRELISHNKLLKDCFGFVGKQQYWCYEIINLTETYTLTYKGVAQVVKILGMKARVIVKGDELKSFISDLGEGHQVAIITNEGLISKGYPTGHTVALFARHKEGQIEVVVLDSQANDYRSHVLGDHIHLSYNCESVQPAIAPTCIAFALTAAEAFEKEEDFFEHLVSHRQGHIISELPEAFVSLGRDTAAIEKLIECQVLLYRYSLEHHEVDDDVAEVPAMAQGRSFSELFPSCDQHRESALTDVKTIRETCLGACLRILCGSCRRR